VPGNLLEALAITVTGAGLLVGGCMVMSATHIPGCCGCWPQQHSVANTWHVHCTLEQHASKVQAISLRIQSSRAFGFCIILMMEGLLFCCAAGATSLHGISAGSAGLAAVATTHTCRWSMHRHRRVHN
jgi:hypothetical protein